MSKYGLNSRLFSVRHHCVKKESVGLSRSFNVRVLHREKKGSTLICMNFLSEET